MTFPTDLDQTVQRSLTGDALSLEALIHACYPAVVRLAVSVLNDPHEAEDAAQEALLSAVTSLDRYRGEASFKTWIYAITLNTCRGYLRERKMRQSVVGALQAIFAISASASSKRESAMRHWASASEANFITSPEVVTSALSSSG